MKPNTAETINQRSVKKEWKEQQIHHAVAAQQIRRQSQQQRFESKVQKMNKYKPIETHASMVMHRCRIRCGTCLHGVVGDYIS